MINLEMSNLCLVSFQSSRLFVSLLCSLQARLDISCPYMREDKQFTQKVITFKHGFERGHLLLSLNTEMY